MPTVASTFAPPVPRLRDGRLLAIEPITPAARPLIERAMARVSPESSRRRFFTPRFRLSERELDALTVLDGHDRFALGAVVRGGDGLPEGVGVARFVRVAGRGDTAEVAVLVVDAFQSQGVGRTLLARLALAALARGIARFSGHGDDGQRSDAAIAGALCARAQLARADGHLDVDVPLYARHAAAAL